MAGEIQAVSGSDVDVTGWFLELVPNDLQHAFKQHEKAKREGNIDLTEQDFLNIPDYIDSYDDILEVRTFKSGDREVVLGKKINGYSVIVELMSNNRKSLHFKNMWGLDTPTYESRYGKRSTASHPDRSSVSANDPTEVYHGTSSIGSIPQTPLGVNLKGRSLGDRVADATKRTLEEMARTEKKARFLKESKPLRDRLAQIQAESKAAMAQIEDRYGRAVADREPGMTETRTETGAKTEADKGKAKPSNMIDLEGELGDRMRRGLKSAIGARKIVGFDGLPEGYRQGFLAGVPNAAPEVRTLLEREAKKADYYVSRGKKSYYRGVSDVIRLSEKSPSSTLAHELFHRIDVRKSISQKLSEAIMQDCVALNVAGGNNVKEYLAQRYPRAFSGMSLDGEMTMGEAYRGIADILNGMSGGKVNFGYGHRKAYWAESGTLEAEAWAQFGRVLYNNDQEVLKMFKELFPNFSRDAILALKELI